jgi:hypothetical protein
VCDLVTSGMRRLKRARIINVGKKKKEKKKIVSLWILRTFQIKL